MNWLFQLDRDIYRAVHVDFRQEWLDPIFVLVTQTGLGHVQFSALIVACIPQPRRWLVPALIALVIATGFAVPAWRDSMRHETLANGFGLALVVCTLLCFVRGEFRRYALPPLLAGIFAGVLRTLFVMVVQRSRPSNFNFADPLEHAFNHKSFPSGHATTSFAIAFSFVLLTRKTDASWLGLLAMAWALLVGFSRIYVGVHWPTDIIAAAGFGLACAAIVHLLMKQDPPELAAAVEGDNAPPLR